MMLFCYTAIEQQDSSKHNMHGFVIKVQMLFCFTIGQIESNCCTLHVAAVAYEEDCLAASGESDVCLTWSEIQCRL